MRQLVLKHPKLLRLVYVVIALLGSSKLIANSGVLSVTVVDENETPLSGVNVFTNDLDFTAVTDGEGKVKIQSMGSLQEVNFSYIGYKTIKKSFFHLLYIERKIKMLPELEVIPPIVVVGRRDDKPIDIPFSVEKISQEEIAFVQAQNAADALQYNGNVFVQKSQMGGGSPIIRGFEANRLLLVVDGVRMNNAIYRNGHLQNAITVDHSILEQAEIIYGPGSLHYGSDALGGVIHYRTKDPKLNRGLSGSTISGHYGARYASANSEQSGHLDFNIGSNKWATLTSLNYSNFGDLRAGANRPAAYPDFGKNFFSVERIDGQDVLKANPDPNVQRNTGYSQIDFMQKFRFQPNNDFYLIANFQYSNSSNIPRYDQLIEPQGNSLKFAEWYYGPQSRSLFSVKSRFLNPNRFFDKGTIIAAAQKIGEDRYQRRTDNVWREATFVDVAVYSFTADFDKSLSTNQKHQLSYGLDISHNSVASEAMAYNVDDASTRSDINTRYPSAGSTLSSFGAYANYRWRTLDSNLVYNAGVRFTSNQLFAQFGADDPITWPAYYLEGISSNNRAFTWSTGLTYSNYKSWQIRWLAATAFRAPNIDDFAKFREKNGFISIPNTSLRPENSLSTELSISKTFGSIRGGIGRRQSGLAVTISGTAFYTHLNNAIVRENFQFPDGSTTLITMGDTLSVQANINSNEANIYGISGNLLINFAGRLKIKSSINYTQGERTFMNAGQTELSSNSIWVPQGHIPPVYGQTSLTYEHRRFRISGIIRYQGRKAPEDYAVSALIQDPILGRIYDRTGTSDNIELGLIDSRGAFLGVYSWQTLNLYTAYQATEKLSVNVSIENLLDTHYRTFASGISAAGRNLIVALRGKF